MSDLTIVLPGQSEQFTNIFMLALAIYREARGEDMAGKIAVGCVIRNRVLHPSWYGRTWFECITKPYQFSSFNLSDPNSIVFGSPTDPPANLPSAPPRAPSAEDPIPPAAPLFISTNPARKTHLAGLRCTCTRLTSAHSISINRHHRDCRRHTQD